MNRGYFQAISSASDENEFAFWIENQVDRPEVLRLLVERYASDIYQLGYIWIYGFQQEKPEKIQFTLFEYTQEVFYQATDKLSDFLGQASVGIWLYRIGIQVAKRYYQKVKFHHMFGTLQRQENLQNPQINASNLPFTKKLEELLPHQREILILRHAYRIDLFQIASILKKDISYVQYELATVRQALFEALEPDHIEQESCSNPDFKYILQAHYDGLLPSSDFMPVELENHLSECKACSKFNNSLVQLGETISEKLNDQPYNRFHNSSDCGFLVENIDKSSVNLGRKVGKGINFIRRSFVAIAVFLAVVFFAYQNISRDSHRGMPLFQSTPDIKRVADAQISNSFQVILVRQTRPLQKTSIYKAVPDKSFISVDGGGYCTIQMQGEFLWVPLQECLELYTEWILDEEFKWFYSGRTGTVSPLKSMVFSPDGNTLAGLAVNSQIYFWNAEDGKLLDSIRLNLSSINDFTYAPDGSYLSVGLYNGTIQSITDFNHVQPAFQKFGGPVFSLEYSPDGKTLTAGGKGAAWSFDISKEEKYILDFYPFPENQVVSLDYSPDGKLLAFGLDDGTIWLYRFKDAKPLARLNGHNGKVFHLRFSPDNKYLASGATDNDVNIWDISNTSSVTKVLTLRHPDWITGLDFSPDGYLLATTALMGRGVFLWSIPEGILLNEIEDDYFFIANSPAFSPDGKSLAIGSTAGSVKLWQVPQADQPIQDK